MNRPYPKLAAFQERLSFPTKDEFGTVGRRHLSGKLAAIHKIIFNEDSKPIARFQYNQMKKYLKNRRDFNNPSSQQNTQHSIELSLLNNQKSSIYKGNNDEDRHHRYDIMQRQSSEIIPRKSSLDSYRQGSMKRSCQQAVYEVCKSHYYNQEKQDSLDKIINPYKAMVQRKRNLNESYIDLVKQNNNQNQKITVSPTYLSFI